MGMFLPGFFTYARMIGYERRWIATILVIQLAAVLFEGIGVGIALPILQYVNSGGDVAALANGSKLWSWMVGGAQAAGIPFNLITLLLAAFLAVIMRQLFMYAREIYMSSVQFELQRHVRDLGFMRYIYANLAYHDRVRAGDFVNEMTTELASATSCMTSAANFIGYVLLSIGYLVIAATLSPGLTAIAVAILGLSALLLLRLMNRILDLGKYVTAANQQMSTFLVERLKSVRLVRLSGVEVAECAMLARHTREQRDRSMDRRRLLARLSVMIEPIVLGLAFILLYVSVVALEMKIESVMLFFFILIRLCRSRRRRWCRGRAIMATLASVEVLRRTAAGAR